MLKHWQQILNTDCEVVVVNQQNIFPIFRNGYTTLIDIADKKLLNSEITNLQQMDVLLRDPRERFNSGLNQVCYTEKLDVIETLHKIEKGEFIDRHFSPQYVWLMQLYRHYKGNVTLRPFKYISDITSVHLNPREYEMVEVKPPTAFLDVDYALMQEIGNTLPLETIIKRYKNVLS